MCTADASCSLTRWQHFYAWNDVMAAILKVWCHIENLTPSIDAFYITTFLPNFSCPIWNDGVFFGPSWRAVAVTRTWWVVMRSVPDLNMCRVNCWFSQKHSICIWCLCVMCPTFNIFKAVQWQKRWLNYYKKNERQYEWVVLTAVIPIFQGGQGS